MHIIQRIMPGVAMIMLICSPAFATSITDLGSACEIGYFIAQEQEMIWADLNNAPSITYEEMEMWARDYSIRVAKAESLFSNLAQRVSVSEPVTMLIFGFSLIGLARKLEKQKETDSALLPVMSEKTC